MSIVNEQSEAMKRLQLVQAALWGLSEGFETVGNHTLALKLRGMTFELEDIQKICEDIFYQHIDNAYQQARQASTNMLGAALAVAELKNKQEDEHHGLP